jgi:phosphatidate cytidylyltransferase
MFRGRVNKPGKFGDLRLRLLSSLAVAAVALLCIWLGGVWIALLAALAAAAMVLEWRSITAHAGGPAVSHVAPYALGAIGGVLMIQFGPVWAAVLVLLGLSAAGLGWDARRGRVRAGFWAVAGTLYIAAAGMAFVALRGFEPFGFLSIVWAALVVIAADVGGYFAGRTIGGPKLWPAVSPNKTWAGLIGGIVLAVLVGWLFSGLTTGTYFLQVCTVSAVAALLAQAGDLAESALKRHFGVKDAGTLMPGHGGLLDRLDGHMAAILVAAAVTFTRDQAVFIW